MEILRELTEIGISQELSDYILKQLPEKVELGRLLFYDPILSTDLPGEPWGAPVSAAAAARAPRPASTGGSRRSESQCGNDRRFA